MISCIAGFLVSSLIIGLTSYLPLWIQGVYGGNASSAGVALLPMTIGWFISSIVSGRIMFSLGPRITCIIGSSFIVFGAVTLAFF
ncbi:MULTISPECIES: hypothetical protein [unclassified Paenibacillus]|nr:MULTISPECIES: hypothetical protein [unclassified Paenibacillus]